MNSKPLISFIIPSYNMGHFLADAIQSCQSVPVHKEIMVIDDGSSDHTSSIAHSFTDVIYHYQQNQGLSAARNKGLTLAKTEYTCFLDADDWLLAENIMESMRLLDNNPEAAFVFGRHFIQKANGSLQKHNPKIDQTIYHHLLKSNIIGNPSTVVYRTRIIKDFPFSSNPLFKGCEDYHQYLQIARKHKVLYHNQAVSVYRRHPANMSNNLAMMLNSALNVLYDHRKLLNLAADTEQWEKGINAWLTYYSYFPLRSGGKWHLNKYHLSLIRKMGWKFPIILFKKWMKHT